MPGSTVFPLASRTSSARPARSLPRAAILPPEMPTSALTIPTPGMTRVPPSTTREYFVPAAVLIRCLLRQVIVGEGFAHGHRILQIHVFHHQILGLLHFFLCHRAQYLGVFRVADVPEDLDLLQRHVRVQLRLMLLEHGNGFLRIVERKLEALHRRLYEI